MRLGCKVAQTYLLLAKQSVSSQGERVRKGRILLSELITLRRNASWFFCGFFF